MLQHHSDALTYEQLTNVQKAAILVMSLDVKVIAPILESLNRPLIERLAVEITHLRQIQFDVIELVLIEFYDLLAAQEHGVRGGMESAQHILRQSLGLSKASEVTESIKSLTHVPGFPNLKGADPKGLAGFLKAEHPQTIALVLSNVDPEVTAEVLIEFSEDVRNNVIHRIATMGRVSPVLMAEMEGILKSFEESECRQHVGFMGGPRSVASILNKLSTTTSKQVMDHIEGIESNLAEEIKQVMLLFEDILLIDDRGIQRVLREVDKKDLALSLKATNEDLREKIYRNMSERARDLLKEELMYLGPVRLKEVEAAQQRIVEVVKQLEETGEVTVTGRGRIEETIV